jgi:hypothetical protein
MPRKRNLTNKQLKTQAIALLLKGATAREVRDRYPQIPKTTIYSWIGELKRSQSDNDCAIVQQSAQEEPKDEVYSVVAEVVADCSKVTPLPSREESDYQLARRVCREVARDKANPPHTRILAVGALAKLVEMRFSLPSTVLDGVEEKSLKEELKESYQRSPEELERRFREILDQTG